MCGIVAYIGKRDAGPILLTGLKRLEYRGYDSSGIALHTDGSGPFVEKAVGQIKYLERKLNGSTPSSHSGIAHTRWATHGDVSESNAHPHSDCHNKVFIVHNGIIENYHTLQQKLIASGHTLTSDTDSEVIAHLIEELYQGNFLRAVQETLPFLEGTYGLAVLHSDHPEEIILARRGSPMVLGKGKDQWMAASDPHALAGEADEFIYMEDNEIALLKRSSHELVTHDNIPIVRLTEKLDLNPHKVEKQDFPHYMLKEIFEQPRVIEDTLRGRIDHAAATAKLGGLENVLDRIEKIRHLVFVACGTSYNAGLYGKYLLSELTDLHIETELASEFRYSNAWLGPESAVVVLSQSGETADTLAALRKANAKGALSLGIVNTVSSTIARETEAGVYMHAGPEIGVASTKAFLSQITILALMTIVIGRARKLSQKDAGPFLEELEAIPEKIRRVLNLADDIKELAERYTRYDNFLYVGRHYHYPIAMEGALKLKEISYIHAEACAAGEMKHGPIALIDRAFPTVALAPSDHVLPKVISNIEEIRARKGPVIAIGTEGNQALRSVAEDVIFVPETKECFYPLLTTVVLQLFAYYMADHRGCEIDKPRNLAKSVTVE